MKTSLDAAQYARIGEVGRQFEIEIRHFTNQPNPLDVVYLKRQLIGWIYHPDGSYGHYVMETVSPDYVPAERWKEYERFIHAIIE
jgi:hypothetical protein